MAFGKFTNDYNVRARASSLSSTDEGLRKFMLKVYGYMSVGLGITGVIAWLFANAFVAQNPIVVSLMQPPMAYLVMFAPLGIILWMSFGINKMRAGMAQNLFWVLAACYGVSLASIFLVYTGATIARVFFIAASMFLTMSIWGYTTKRSLAKMGSFFNDGTYRINNCIYSKYIPRISLTICYVNYWCNYFRRPNSLRYSSY